MWKKILAWLALLPYNFTSYKVDQNFNKMFYQTICTPPLEKISILGRFGKSTYISMISNSVTYPRSYTNSTIADTAGNSVPISPRRRLRIEHRYRCIECPRVIADVAAPNADVFTSSAGIVAWNDLCLSVSWCITSGSLCITMFYMCFMMFRHNDRRRRIGDRAAADCLRDRDNAIGIGDNSAEIGMALQWSLISPRTWSHAQLHPEWRLEYLCSWRKIPEGISDRFVSQLHTCAVVQTPHIYKKLFQKTPNKVTNSVPLKGKTSLQRLS